MADDVPEGAAADASVVSSEPLVIRMPIDVRNAALAALAVIAVVFVLHWAQSVLIPIVLAIFISYTLMPVVLALEGRLKLPVPISAGIALGLLVIAVGFGISALRPQALELLDLLPRAAKKLDAEIRSQSRQAGSAMQKMKSAAAEIEKAAESATATTSGGSAQAPTQKPANAPRSINLGDYLWLGTLGVAVLLFQAVIVVALAYFLLVSGHDFKRKVVRISGETLSKKKITVQILDEIDRQIQRYLLVHVVTSAAYGALLWVALEWLGLDNAPFWAVVAAVLHLIPYLGVIVVTLATALIAFLQFPEIWRVAAVPASSLVISGVIGLLIFPWFSERLGRINAVSVFIALLFWGWLWGVWGLLLGVPIMMVLKSVCERVEGLRPIAELLSTEAPKTELVAQPAQAPPAA